MEILTKVLFRLAGSSPKLSSFISTLSFSFAIHIQSFPQFHDNLVGLNWREIKLKIFLKIRHTDLLSPSRHSCLNAR